MIQNIINIASVIAFIMTSITWICAGIARSIRIQFDVLDHRTDRKSCKVYVRIVNKSLMPINIYAISIIDNSYEHFCYLQPKLVRKENELLFYSAEFPINLSAFEGRQCYIEFRNFPKDEPIQLIENKTLAFRICTNRKAIMRHVTLGKISHYLHIRP